MACYVSSCDKPVPRPGCRSCWLDALWWYLLRLDAPRCTCRCPLLTTALQPRTFLELGDYLLSLEDVGEDTRKAWEDIV